ncbi:MAG: paraquat-inducible protein A, partial [Verrucomicrobiaceae bacterium]|nr:paraquat-inducible protein A [Verrucomicrobiaceae bacterium]
MTRPVILGLIGISCLLFGSAVALPIFTIEPKAGDWTELAAILSPPDMQPQTMRLLQGVGILWNEGERMLALLIALFSLILPTLKLTMLWMEGILSEGLPDKWIMFLRAVSRYAMLEVFLVALTVLLIKEMPGGSRITLQSGFYTFS